VNRIRARLTRVRDDPNAPGKILAAAMLVSAALILWLGRDGTFSGDEARIVASSPGLGLRTILEPHGGHLLALTRLVYWPILHVTGLDYLPFRILSVAAILLAVALLFVWARKRVDAWVALGPCVLLLFFGSDPLHMFQGNGFTVLLSVALGIGALLAIERGDRRGDLIACGLLALGVLTYTVILAFLVGIAGLLAWRRQWSRSWVFLVPLGLYALWRVWLIAANVDGDGGGIQISDILLVPAWTFQSVAGVLAALTGLGYDFTGAGTKGADPVGPALAVLAFAALLLSIGRRGIGPTLATVCLVALTLWAMQALAAGDASGLRIPGGDSRYMYPGAFVVLLVAFAAAPPARPDDRVLAILAVVTVALVSVNVMIMRDGAQTIRESGQEVRSLAGAIRLSGATTGPAGADTSTAAGALAALAGSPYGEFGYGADELLGRPEPQREELDRVMAAAGGLRLGAGAGEWAGRCRPAAGGQVVATPGTAVVMSPRGGTLLARRLADQPTVTVGTLEAGRPARVILPGRGSLPWTLTVVGQRLETCG